MALTGRHQQEGIALEQSAGPCAVAGSATVALVATDLSVGLRAHQQ